MNTGLEGTTVKIEIYIPGEYILPLREALAEAGAGKIGNYDHCISIIRVTGYWRPLPGAEPFQGEVGEISAGSEYKVEVNCPIERVEAALAAVRRIHPYDEPLVNVVPLLNHLFKGATQ